MEAVSPYMEMASTYLVTPYGVAALAGVILVRFVLFHHLCITKPGHVECNFIPKAYLD